MNIKYLFLTALVAVACTGNAVQSPYRDNDIEKQVEKVLSGMSLEEKAGQMVQLTIGTIETPDRNGVDEAKLVEVLEKYKIGSFLNVLGDRARSREETEAYIRIIQEKSMEILGIPTIYGLDMIHGASYLTDGTLFPQEINLAATFNRSYPAAMGEAMGYETRAAMVPWVFSPVMDLGRDPRWSRHWESWGEDPYLSSEMAVVETRAIQGGDPNHVDKTHAAVSIKHFMAYGAPWSGKDRTPAYLSPIDLREKYFRPFKECFEAGALTAMINSASINGVPTHANEELLTGWVKDDLGWDGMMVTDWADINNLYTREHIAVDRKDAVRIGINAGIDMIMDPYDPTTMEDIVALAEEGSIPMSRIDDAVRRILRLKIRLGLFEEPVWEPELEDFNKQEWKDASYQAALESEVLLKNEDAVLPIKEGTRILVTGPNANSLRALNGGWSYTWQGDADAFVPQYSTIYEALSERYGASRVILEEGVVYDNRPQRWQNEDASGIARAVAAASRADVIVACVGENSYCETPGNMDDLNLSVNQKELVRRLAATGKPIVLVLNEGRPRIIGDIEPLAKAVVDVMLPGNYGGDALAALLSGDENFSGRLPFTYSKHINALHTYDYKVSEHSEVMNGMYNYDAIMDVQWPFGHGLSYTQFEYSGLEVIAGEHFGASDELKFAVTVKNVGGCDGKEAVLLYSSDLVASIIPDVKRLRGFEKIALKQGESRKVEFSLPASELAFVGADGRWRLEEGDFRISCGGLSVNVHCDETEIWDTPNI